MLKQLIAIAACTIACQAEPIVIFEPTSKKVLSFFYGNGPSFTNRADVLILDNNPFLFTTNKTARSNIVAEFFNNPTAYKITNFTNIVIRSQAELDAEVATNSANAELEFRQATKADLTNASPASLADRARFLYMLRLINTNRVANGLGTITVNQALNAVQNIIDNKQAD